MIDPREPAKLAGGVSVYRRRGSLYIERVDITVEGIPITFADDAAVVVGGDPRAIGGAILEMLGRARRGIAAVTRAEFARLPESRLPVLAGVSGWGAFERSATLTRVWRRLDGDIEIWAFEAGDGPLRYRSRIEATAATPDHLGELVAAALDGRS